LTERHPFFSPTSNPSPTTMGGSTQPEEFQSGNTTCVLCCNG
jgi:hypothetical protein